MNTPGPPGEVKVVKRRMFPFINKKMIIRASKNILAVIFAATGNLIFSYAFSGEIAATLLSKSRQLNNNNNNNNNQELAWLVNSHIKCYTGTSYRNDQGFCSILLAKFQLCPSGSTDKKCLNGGDYVVSMEDFVETYSYARTRNTVALLGEKDSECEVMMSHQHK